MANAIVIIAPNKHNQLQYCYPSAWLFAQKYGYCVKTVTEEVYNFPKKKYNFKIFEKFQVQQFTQEYDRILRLDSDTIISPDCPDIFKLFPEEKLWAVYEDVGNRQKDRRNQIDLIQNSLGKLNWTEGYINSGVVLTSRAHKELYNMTKENLLNVMRLPLGKFKEQNLLNWRIRYFGYEVGDMGFKFNHMSMNNGNILDSYIVHVAGKQSDKEQKMKQLYNQWYGT